MSLRAIQVVAYASMILNYAGVGGGLQSVLLLILIGVIYSVVDYIWILPQEQSFMVKKNHELQRLIRENKP